MKKALKLLVIYFCGYISIRWVFLPQPCALANFFLWIVIHPLEFFSTAIAFLIGFILIGQYIREMTRNSNLREKQKRWSHFIHIDFIGLSTVFFLLLLLGWVRTIVLFSLGYLYGMIPVDKQES